MVQDSSSDSAFAHHMKKIVVNLKVRLQIQRQHQGDNNISLYFQTGKLK